MAEDIMSLLQDFLVAPHWYPVVPIVGFLVIAGASVGLSGADYADGRSGGGAAAWPAPMALSLAFLGVWVALGNYSDELMPLVAYTVAAVVCGVLCANRGLVRAWATDGGPMRVAIRDAVALLLGVAFTVMALELSWNTSFPALDPKALGIELGLAAGIVVALYFLGQRTGAVAWVPVILAIFAGTCQYFLARFKGVAILPSDLLAMPTALRVKEGYSFVLDGRGLLGPAAGCVALTALSMLGTLPDDPVPSIAPAGRHSAQLVGGPSDQERRGGRLAKVLRVLANLGLGVLVAAATCAAMVLPHYIRDLGIAMDYGKTLESYRTDGFLTGFVAAAQDLPISAPAAYTRPKAAELQVTLDATYDEGLGATERRAAAAAQFDADRPSVVVVMNESFSDLSVFDGLGVGYEGPTFFKSIDDALLVGDLAVSVIGGGTCNTEFEFLTGNSYAFVGAGKYPYVTYRLRGENLASQLSALGYTTTAIHPNDPTNWNRDVVYQTMGFDRFLSIDDFAEDTPQLHMGVTDAATYDKVIELLQLETEPQFVFDVTMQNHGSYNLGNIPEDRLVTVEPAGLAEGDVTQEDADALSEYLSCIKASDEDLAAFIARLRELDRKVVVVFFGDHQPAFTPLYNDLYFADEEDEVAHKERVYQTDYFIWANYDVAETAQVSEVLPASADMLGALTLDLIGAPVSSYQKARLVASQEVPALNAFGYLGADGVWYARGDEASPYLQSYDALAYLNYLNFGSKVTRWPISLS